MKYAISLIVVLIMYSNADVYAASNCAELLDYRLRLIDAQREVHLCEEYKGKVVLVVNTASRCAFTPQYKGLERLYREKRDQGLVILGFPSNDFGNQEPGGEKSIMQFCKLKYDVEFPMFKKIRVRGDQAHPFYKALTAAADSSPKWNFHKYLIGRDGRLIDDYSSFRSPDGSTVRSAVERALQE